MESLYSSCGDTVDITTSAAVSAGEIIQLADGRAGQVTVDAASGALVGVRVNGILKSVAKTASVVCLKGGPAYWDASANAATPNEPIGSSDKDFFIGVFHADASSSATTCEIIANVEPRYIIDSARDNG